MVSLLILSSQIYSSLLDMEQYFTKNCQGSSLVDVQLQKKKKKTNIDDNLLIE